MTLEDELKNVLTDDRRALRSWPDATERVHSGMRRRRRRRVATGAVALAVLAVPALIVGLLRSPEPTTPGIVQPAQQTLHPSPPQSTPTPTPSDAPFCTAADFANPATSSGTSQVVITLTDKGTTPCQLSDTPVLVTVDASKAVHTVPVDTTEDINALPPPVQPGQAVRLVVEASTACSSSLPTVYTGLAVRFDGGARIPIPGLTLTSSCVLRIGNWHPAGASVDPTPSSPATSASSGPVVGRPCVAADLASTATAPDESGMAGNILHFVDVRSVGRSACTLSGYPALTGAGGRTIPVDDGTLIGKDGTVATIHPGGTATVGIVTSFSCAGGDDPTTYKDVHIIVAGRSLAVPGLVLGTTCPIHVGTWFIR